jgi:hypothetical protein
LSLLAVWFEPADIRKAGKVFQSGHWTSLGFVSPNLNELQVMSLASGKVWYLYVKFSFQIGLNIIPLRHSLHYRDNHKAVKNQQYFTANRNVHKSLHSKPGIFTNSCLWVPEKNIFLTTSGLRVDHECTYCGNWPKSVQKAIFSILLLCW